MTHGKLKTALATLALLAATAVGAPTAATAATTTSSVHVVAGGDVACATPTAITCQQAATAKQIGTLNPTYLFALGDLSYPFSTTANLTKLYTPSWGKYKAITKPVPGNHDFVPGTGLADYYTYWGSKAHKSTGGYYSFNVGAWHAIVLNTAACANTGICPDFTAQAAWVKADLAANAARKCTVALVHHPLFSGGAAPTRYLLPLYNELYAGHVDLVLAGHIHDYQRDKPSNPAGALDPNGFTQIIIGTGGDEHKPPLTQVPVPNRVTKIDTDFGVLDLQLASGGWSSKFKTTTGKTLDPATGICR